MAIATDATALPRTVSQNATCFAVKKISATDSVRQVDRTEQRNTHHERSDWCSRDRLWIASTSIVLAVLVGGCGSSEPARGANQGGQGGVFSAAGTSPTGRGGLEISASFGGIAGTTGGALNTTAGSMLGSSNPGGQGGSGESSFASAVMGGYGAGAGSSSLGVGAQAGSGATSQVCAANRGNYCVCMPMFVGTQVVDGLGDEFSSLAPMTFTLSAASYVNPSRAMALPETVTLRAGWSDIGMHVYIHVDDPSIVPDSSTSLWNGDNVQLFVAPTAELTGTYTGTQDGGAIHVLISAPDAANASHAVVIYQNGPATNSPFVTGLYAGRRVAGGYDVEAQLQWLAVAKPRQSGAAMGFDLLVGAASDSSSGLALEGGLSNYPVSGPSPACDLGGRVQPGCDDRTWCRPTLE